MPSETAEAFCRRVNRAVPLSRTFPGRSDQVAAARQFIRDALAECPGAADVVLLTSELAANAILHSASGDGGSFGVALHQVPALVRVEVTDGGSPAGPEAVAAGPAVGPCPRRGRPMAASSRSPCRYSSASDPLYKAVANLPECDWRDR